MSSLKYSAPLIARLEAHARLHDQFCPGDEQQAQWAADMREAIEAIRERDDLAQQRGGLAAKLLKARQLVSVSSIDVEKLIAACVPGGSVCDPQAVADAIRRYCDAWPSVASESQPSEQTK